MNGQSMTDLIENYDTQLSKKSLGIWLDLSTYCNAKCPQCHRTNANGLEKADWLPLIQWSYDEFVRMFPVKTLKNLRHFDICGSWGDPIMNKDIFKIVEYIIKNTSKTTVLINTNGSFRNADWWWNLGLIGGRRIRVMWAIEGVDQKQQSHYRQNTNLDLVLENMEAFSLAGGWSQVFTVVFEHNEKDLYNISELVKDNGAEEIFFVQSNRFYDNNAFDFVDALGRKKVLRRTNLENKPDFYWRTWHLYDKNHMKRIEYETAK